MSERYKPRHMAPKNLSHNRTPAMWCDVARTGAMIVGVLVELIQVLKG